jgi:RNA-directed DNA polymerase
MKDRAMQALYLLALEPVAETTGDPNSYGFRPERSTADAVKQGFNALSRECSAQWILEGDIQGCFDHISHDWMVRHIPTDKTVLQKWLKAGYIENRILFPTKAGTPQGGIVSPTLANMTLDGLEQLLTQHFPKETWRDGKRWRPKINLVRYADDFIITGDSRELLENEVRPLVEQFQGAGLNPLSGQNPSHPYRRRIRMMAKLWPNHRRRTRTGSWRKFEESSMRTSLSAKRCW